MSERISRFQKRKDRLSNYEALTPVPDPELVEKHLDSSVDDERIKSEQFERNKYYNLGSNIDIGQLEVDTLLQEITHAIKQEQINELLESCKQQMLHNIVSTFGIGHVVAKRDKEGGRVLTLNNAKTFYQEYVDGNYTREAREIFNDRIPKKLRYSRDKYRNYRQQKVMDDIRNQRKHDNPKCDYTGNPIKSTNPPEVDHIIPLGRIHYKYGGFMLPTDRKIKIASDKTNLAFIGQEINRSKKDRSIKKIQHDKPELGIDRRLTRHKETNANIAIGKHEPNAMDNVKYYGSEGGIEAGVTGLTYGIQQSISILIAELLSGILDEAKDIFMNGLKKNEENFSSALARRAKKVLTQVQNNFKEVISAFREGFQSGFLSEIVTIICNLFKVTSKRMVRIIREGFLSILKALKILMSPPENMTRLQAIDSASKLFATALITSGGILMEEMLEKWLVSVMGPFALCAPYISLLISGVLTAIFSALIVYTLSKIDLFGVEAGYRRQCLFDELDQRIEETLHEAQDAEAIFTPPFVQLQR